MRTHIIYFRNTSYPQMVKLNATIIYSRDSSSKIPTFRTRKHIINLSNILMDQHSFLQKIHK